MSTLNRDKNHYLGVGGTGRGAGRDHGGGFSLRGVVPVSIQAS